jgi:DNA-binding transcriptional MerR regulator
MNASSNNHEHKGNAMVFTIGQAAKESGKSKSTIWKYLKNGTLSAQKNDDGTYSIDAAELFRVFPPTGGETFDERPTELNTNHKLSLENEVLKVQLAAQSERIQTLEADKHFLQEQLQRTTLLLTSVQDAHKPQQETPQPKKRHWWPIALRR